MDRDLGGRARRDGAGLTAPASGVSVDAAAGLPRGPWRGEAVLVFRRAAYFLDGAGSGALLGVTGRGLGPGPAGLELSVEAPGEALALDAGAPLDFDGARWRLDGRVLGGAGAVVEEPVRLPAGPRIAPRRPLAAALDEAVGDALPGSLRDAPHDGPFGAPRGASEGASAGPGPSPDAEWAFLRRAAEVLGEPSRDEAALAAEAIRLLGRGSGSTPSGDDLLVGWLAGLARQGRPLPAVRAAIAARLCATCRLSRHFLGHALAGRFHRAFVRLAALREAPAPTHPLVLALRGQGDRSGRAAYAGWLAGLRQGA